MDFVFVRNVVEIKLKTKMEEKDMSKIRFIIKGKDRYGSVDSYGKFDNMKECLKYLEFLKRSTIGATVKLWWEEL